MRGLPLVSAIMAVLGGFHAGLAVAAMPVCHSHRARSGTALRARRGRKFAVSHPYRFRARHPVRRTSPPPAPGDRLSPPAAQAKGRFGAIGAPLVPGMTAAAPLTVSAEEVYRRLQSVVFKLLTRVQGQAEGASYGTAFVIDRSGILATNYHVVAQSAIEPGKYELVLQLPSGPLKASVIGIDISNDLALVRVPVSFPMALPLAPPARGLSMGEKVFSIGLPKDLTMSIIEGNFNGYIPAQRGRVLVTSSALNHGMSGGPTVNASGEVIGINRAIEADAQNISFLSDAQALVQLYQSSMDPNAGLGGAARAPASLSSGWRTVVERQVQELEGDLLGSLRDPRAVPIMMGNVQYGNLPQGSRCGRDRVGDPDSPAQLDEMSCRNFTLANADGQHPVSRIRVMLLGLGSKRASLRKELFGDPRVNLVGARLFSDAIAAKTQFTPPDCDERVVENGKGVRVRVDFCTTRFRHFDHLYRMLAKVGIYDGVSNRDLALFEFSGFSESGLSRLVDYYVNSIQVATKPEGL